MSDVDVKRWLYKRLAMTTIIFSPAIVSVQPNLNEYDEWNSDITAVFSEAIIPNSIDSSRITLQGPSGVVEASVNVGRVDQGRLGEKDVKASRYTANTPSTAAIAW